MTKTAIIWLVKKKSGSGGGWGMYSLGNLSQGRPSPRGMQGFTTMCMSCRGGKLVADLV